MLAVLYESEIFCFGTSFWSESRYTMYRVVLIYMTHRNTRYIYEVIYKYTCKMGKTTELTESLKQIAGILPASKTLDAYGNVGDASEQAADAAPLSRATSDLPYSR